MEELHPLFVHPTESYSRYLNERVNREEMPYGYNYAPPPADTGDYDMASKESKVRYPKGRIR